MGKFGKNKRQPVITWIEHATFLIRMEGLNIVTDPAAMPEIDVVLISHSHYDHFHFPSLRSVKGDSVFFVPEGLSGPLIRNDFRRTRELSWWSSVELAGVRFSFVPAQHWTQRTPWDMNASHWGDGC
ncbi:MBL fold metallo-hydrolase [Ferviditalea candida]|uniref:MBL fold metallo-hydrolase n=1 Tax=Ferviditalea candida TaxID=3108399 RepID=A0ABU5ZGF8_9BACL|nr:MBL fold metallo-hydrolase [Paenibacillaceae bacterium T2]